MKKSLIALTASLALVTFNAVAHGDAKPLHGGIVQVASDLQFELVPNEHGAALYVVDHGEPADVSNMSGKLTVLNGTKKTEAQLTAAGANKLESIGVTVAAGSKVVARVTDAGGKATTVRFTVK